MLSTKFFSDKTRVAISFSNGMIAMYNTSNHCTELVLPLGSAIIDLIMVKDDSRLFCAGIDPYLRIYDLADAKVTKFKLHPYSTNHMIVFEDHVYTFGYDKRLVKFNYIDQKIVCVLQCYKNVE